jgi:cholesterol transport system auxiliary component
MRPTMTLPSTLVLALAGALSLPGCSGLFGSTSEPIQMYMFEPRAFEAPPRNDSTIVLLISPIQSVGLDSRQMAYAMRPFERTYFVTSQWADTPGRMIEPLLVQAMEHSGMFNAVVDEASTVVADLRLEVHLLVMQQEFSTTPSRGRLVMRAQLSDLRDNRVMATRLFEESVQAPSDNPYGGAVALNLALEAVLDEMVAWVRDFIAITEAPW